MAVYFLDNDQQLIKIVPDNGAISILQTQELPEDNSLLKDTLSVRLKNDERLFDAQYMAIKSYDGNRNSFDMYRIVNELVPDNATEFEGVQVAPYELEGVVVEDIRPQGWTIERTTNQILKDSDWRLGYVDDNLPTVTTNFYYLSAKDSLKKLQELTGVEFTFKVEISGNKITDKWVEVYKELGNRTLKRFNYGTNALTVKRETNHSELYTALIGRGKGEEVGETESGDATYGRKINFADVEWKKSNGKPVDKPKGQKYIELPQATAEYGIKLLDGRKVPRIGLVEFSDTEDPEVLIEQTWQALQEYARPKVLFSATVANIGDTGIGDTVTIHRHDLNMHYKTRVRKVMRNRKNNDKTQVEIGDVVYTASTKQQANINSQLNNMQNDLSNVKGEVSHVVTSADGKNDITFSNTEPERKKVGDSWVRDHPSLAGETQWLVWDGEAWELIMDTSETSENARKIAEQQQDIVEAKQTADEAVEQINTAVANAGFTSLDETISSVQSISNQTQINAGTAIDNALEAIQQASQAVENTGSLNVRVDEVENTLSVKADKQTVDDLTGVVDTQALDIQANAQGLALKANQNTVDTLAGTVQSLGTEFDVVAGQVNSRVWNTDIESAVDGLEYENRNYLRNSDFSQGNDYWHNSAIQTIDDTSYAKISDNWSTRQDITNTTEQKDYTLSFNVRNDNLDEKLFYTWIGYVDSSGTNVFILAPRNSIEGKTETSLSFKFTVPSDNIRIYLKLVNGETGSVLLSYPKLEKGNKATDWTPAPEDTDAKIDYIETEWTQTFDSFSQTVAGIDGRVTAQTQEIDRITSTVADSEGRISVVEQNVNGIQQTVSDPVNGLVTQVSTLASGFNVLASDFENMEIGGRNLYLGSSTDWKSVSWTLWNVSLDYIHNIEAGEAYTASVSYKNVKSTAGQIGIRIFWYDINWNRVKESPNGTGLADGENGRVSVTDIAPSGATRARVILRRYTNSGSQSAQYSEIKFEKGTVATDWTPAPEDMATQAQLSVLNDNINMRVSKGELMSQINIEAGRTLIQSDRLLLNANNTVITGTAWMDGAVIANASIDGAKIQDATIGSAKIANLDANKITTGRLEGIEIIAERGYIANFNIVGNNLSSSTPHGHTTVKGGGEVAFATASPQANNTSGAKLQIWHDGTLRFDYGGQLRFQRQGSGGLHAATIRTNTSDNLQIESWQYINIMPHHTVWVDGHINPYVIGGTWALGNDTYRWRSAYLQFNPNVSSDTRFKTNIQDIPEKLLEKLKEVKPKQYEMDGTTHFGYIAQDVERALYKYAVEQVGYENAREYMDTFDLLGRGESYLSLIYAEIAVLKDEERNRQIKELENRIKELENAS